jgi:hypothetical protein
MDLELIFKELDHGGNASVGRDYLGMPAVLALASRDGVFVHFNVQKNTFDFIRIIWEK